MSRTDDGGFLSRWARRKAESRTGAVAAEPPAAAVEPHATPRPPEIAGVATRPAVLPDASAQAAEPGEAPPPPPTWDDLEALTPQDDFRRFVASDVDPGVRNAAMKKLFSDPHYNVMDGLDIYIDDYGKPDPLPPGMLRRLAQSRFLGLFDDEARDPATAAAPAADPHPIHDENPDLRLQPDDAVGPDAGEPDRPDPGGDTAGQR